MSPTSFYDRYWRNGLDGWSARHPEPTALERRLLDRFVAPGQTVLDVGCGDGKIARLLQPRGVAYRGLDVADEAVQLCRRQGFDADLHDLSQPLPQPDASCDVVTVFEVLEHLFLPQHAVMEMVRVLRPGGCIIGSVPNAVHLANRLLMLAGRFNPGGSPATSLHAPWRDPHVRFFSPRTLRAMIRERTDLQLAGLWGSPFSLLEQPILYRARGVFRSLLAGASWPLGWLGSVAPALWSHRLYFVARRA